MRTLLGIGLLLASCELPFFSCPAVAATRIEPIHPERDRMSAAARRDQVLADLDTILSGPASRTGIATAPYLSNRNGLCQRDVIYLDYDREQEGTSNDRFVPVGIGGFFREFHFLGFESGPREGWKEACQGLADKDVYWARSDDDSTASWALANLALAVADVSEGNVSIDCTELDDIENEAECASDMTLQ
jgi:hypothetical protein